MIWHTTRKQSTSRYIEDCCTYTKAQTLYIRMEEPPERQAISAGCRCRRDAKDRGCKVSLKDEESEGMVMELTYETCGDYLLSNLILNREPGRGGDYIHVIKMEWAENICPICELCVTFIGI